MNKFIILLLAGFASANTLANETSAPLLQLNTSNNASIKQLVSNNGLSPTEAFAAQKTQEIYEYAESVFEDISTKIEQEFLSGLEKHLSVRITRR